ARAPDSGRSGCSHPPDTLANEGIPSCLGVPLPMSSDNVNPSASSSSAHGPHANPLAVFRRIVPRDRALLALLAEHYLLSTPQIAAGFFDSRRTAQRRLTTLHHLGVVHRFAYPNDAHTAVPYLYTLARSGCSCTPTPTTTPT